MTVLHIKAFCGVAALALATDMVPTSTAPVDAFGRLSLDGVLIVGVIALWRELRAERARIAEKDAQVVAMATEVTKTMTLVLEAVKELRGAVNELREEHGLQMAAVARR